MESDEQTVLMLGLIGLAAIARKRMSKRRRERDWLKRRKELICFDNLMKELALEDKEGYRRWLRMDVCTFEELLALVTPLIEKKNTRMKEAIPAAERLALTLRFLATGETQSSLSFQFRIAQNTISGIIPAVCSAICFCLKDYIEVPDTEEEWTQVTLDFWKKQNFPMCLGALDGKHVKIKPPPKYGAMFRNYKGFSSIALLALVDANLKFIYIDVGTNGRTSDGGVWEKSKLKALFATDSLHIPPPANLPGSDVKVPYVIVADDAFPLTTHVMKPYAGNNLSHEKLIYNNRLSRAHRVSENAFSLLAARFRIFHTPILSSVESCKSIVMASCYLHNFLLTKSNKLYEPQEMESIDRSNLCSFKKNLSRGTDQAKDVRDRFCHFFTNEGAVS